MISWPPKNIIIYCQRTNVARAVLAGASEVESDMPTSGQWPGEFIYLIEDAMRLDTTAPLIWGLDVFVIRFGMWR